MKVPIEWQTDADAILVEPDVHDGSLVHVSWTKKQRLSVEIERQGEPGVIIELSEIEYARIAIWDGAIIGGVSIWRADSVPEDRWSTPGDGWSALYGPRYLQRDIGKMASANVREVPEWYLVIIHGCSSDEIVAALCRTISIGLSQN